MVQLRHSLEALVLQAWRDRWTELEWSNNLKSALLHDSSEVNKLCGLLIRQATLSEVPNELMFKYLSHTVASHVVSHSSLLDAVVQYVQFDRELCIDFIIDIVNFVRDRLRCSSSNPYECEKLVNGLAKLLQWGADGMQKGIDFKNLSLIQLLLTTLLQYMQNIFVNICLYFNYLQSPEDHHMLTERLRNISLCVQDADWVCDRVSQAENGERRESLWSLDQLKANIRSLNHKIVSVPHMLDVSPVNVLDPRELVLSGSAHPAAITLASLYASVRLADSAQSFQNALTALQQSLRLPWWLLLRDVMRGALLVLMDPGPAAPDSSVTAFVYLKMFSIPRVLRELVLGGIVQQTELSRALECLAALHSLHNSLDIKLHCNCFKYFVDELKNVQLVNEAEMHVLMELRNKECAVYSEPSPNSQISISLVLKAEPTFQTLIKSFNSDFAQKQDKLVQMMYHMITGKSFEFICAAAAATSKLDSFTAKLVQFNWKAQKPPEKEAPGESAQLRSTMFDLSFLLLCRIGQMYSYRPPKSKPNSDHFFDRWSNEYGPHPEYKPNTSNTSTKETESILQQLRNGQVFWTSQTSDWGSICYRIPQIGNELLNEIKSHQISNEQLKSVFCTLQSEMCSLLLCLTQWLVLVPSSESSRTLATSLYSYFECTPPTASDGRSHVDRWNFMGSTAKKLVEPILSVESVQCPPSPWLIQCARRQLPHIYTPHMPTNDHLRQAFHMCFRNAWAQPSVLAMLDKVSRNGDPTGWSHVWMKELIDLVTADEMSLAAELCVGVALLCPEAALQGVSDLLLDRILAPGHELFCVAPKGNILARLLVQMHLLALLNKPEMNCLNKPDINSSTSDINYPEPLPKVRKRESASGSEVVPVNDPSTALVRLYERLVETCEENQARPSVYFVATFLSVLSEQTGPAAKHMISLLPPALLNQVIKIDPKVVSAPTILALYDLTIRSQRQKALQNLCLLRDHRAL